MASIQRRNEFQTSRTNEDKRTAQQHCAAFGDHKRFLTEFLRNFESDDFWCPKYKKKKYMAMLQGIANSLRDNVTIEVEDLFSWSEKEGPKRSDDAASLAMLVRGCVLNTLRYEQLAYDAAAEALPPKDHHDVGAQNNAMKRKTKIARMYEEMNEFEKKRAIEENRDLGSKDPIPKKLRHPFEVFFSQPTVTEGWPMRKINSDTVGKLVTFHGIVTKITGVRPKMEIATYECSKCGGRTFQSIQGEQFMPVQQCESKACRENKVNGLEDGPKMLESRLVRQQEMKVQELSSEVPVGGVPRTMNCLLFGDQTRKVLPGESIAITGVYVPHMNIGPQTGGRTQVMMFCHVHSIKQHKAGHKDEMDAKQERLLQERIVQASKDPQIYDKLAKSIAPQIFGMEDVKKALLLLLVGGVHKPMGDGMHVRGNLHVLLMGDPGVAKSQLLKQVSIIAPRAVYTTGKGSSGVGLTAAVTRDQTTGESTLEGGALVLADSGVCCIDEFDKMEDADRTAIYEVMEQQVVSIAKAGITTTLNARASLLAAANPVFGRYNLNKSPIENMNLPAALLSRFDLKFLLLDHVNAKTDLELAKFVLDVHRRGNKDEKEDADEGGTGDQYDAKFLRAYIKKTKEFEPLIPQMLEEKIVLRYVDMRKAEREEKADERKDYVTPRQLLGMIRLAMALAKLRFCKTVDESHWEEAVRLTESSKASILADNDQPAGDGFDFEEPATGEDQGPRATGARNASGDDEIDAEKMNREVEEMVGNKDVPAGDQRTAAGSGSAMDGIFEIISGECGQRASGPMFVSELKQKVLKRGFNEQQFEETIEYYCDMGVLEYTDELKTALQMNA